MPSVERISYHELDVLHAKFQEADLYDEGSLTRKELARIPEIASNPFGDRIHLVCRFGEDDRIGFKDFVMSLSTLSTHGSRERKMKAVFSLYDVDEDGRIGRRDLLLTLRRITNFPAGVDGTAILKDIVLRTMAEASSSDRKDFLTFGDFSKVMMMHGGEFDRKINIDWLKLPPGSGAQGGGSDESDKEKEEGEEEEGAGEGGSSEASGGGGSVPGSSGGTTSLVGKGSATRGATPVGDV